MDYAKKLDRMDRHLAEHPHDYQTVIAKLKLASKAFDHQQRMASVTRLKRLTEVRRQLKEIRSGDQ